MTKTCPRCLETFPSSVEACPHDGTVFSGDDMAVGTVLDGKYRLDRHLAAGGMASVYAATRLSIGDTVAIKVLTASALLSPLAVARFSRESRAAARIRHPGVVEVYDFSALPDGRAYLVMEYLAGRSVRAELEAKGKLTPDRAVEIVSQVCSAMQVAHEAGIIHRDLKPENIVAQIAADGRERFKVVDFGVAELREKVFADAAPRLTEAGMMVGTPYYMSPEQCQAQDLDARSDVYSLGVILYEMLAGTVPFASRTVSAVIIQQVTEIPRPLRELRPDIGRALEHVVARALSKDRAERQQSAAELAAELQSALAAGAFHFFANRTIAGPTEVSEVGIPRDLIALNRDPATRLVNAAFFRHSVEAACGDALPEGGTVVLIGIELSGPDTEPADQLVWRVVEWLADRIDSLALVGRTGTTHVSVMFAGEAVEALERKAQALLAACANSPRDESGTPLTLRPTVAMCPRDGRNMTVLMDRLLGGAPVAPVLSGAQSDCLDLVRREFERARRGFTRMVVVWGDAAEVFGTVCRGMSAGDALVIRVRLSSFGDLSPLQSFLDPLRGLVRFLAEASPRRMMGVFGSLTRQVLDLFADPEADFPVPPFDMETERHRVYELVSRMYWGLSRLSPVILRLDGMEVAEAADLELLTYLQANGAGHRLLILAGMPGTTGQAVTNWIHSMANTGTLTVATSAGPPNGPLSALAAETEESKLADLEPGVRDVLARAAVIGDEFSYELLEAVAATDDARLLTALETAIKAGILEERTALHGDHYRFARSFHREALYRRLSGNRRRRLHTRIGEILAGRLTGSEVPPELGRHYLAAGDLEHALAYAIAAGNRAWTELAPVEAYRQFIQAEQIIEECGSGTRQRLVTDDVLASYHVHFGTLRLHRGESEKARLELDMALAFGRKLESSAVIGAAEAAAAKLDLYYGDLRSGETLAANALKSLRSSGDMTREIKAQTIAAAFSLERGKCLRAFTEYETALALARACGDGRGTYEALWGMGTTCRLLGWYARAAAYADEALAGAQSVGDTFNAARITLLTADIALDLGKPGEAAGLREAALRVFRGLGYRLWEGLTLVGIGDVMYAEHRFDEAQVYFQESLHLGRSIGSPRLETWARLGLGVVLAARGRYPEAAVIFTELAASPVASDRLVLATEIDLELGNALLGQRRPAPAREAYARAREAAMETGIARHQWRAAHGVARCERMQGNRAAALTHLRAAVEAIETVAAELTSYADRNRFLKDLHPIYNDLAEVAQEAGGEG